MAFRTSLRTALLGLTVFCLLTTAHASYNFYLALDGNYPGRTAAPPQGGHPGGPRPPTDLYPCFSFSFLAPPPVAGGQVRRLSLMSTSAQNLNVTKLPKGVNQILVGRVVDTFSPLFAAAVTDKTAYPTLALSYRWTGADTVIIPVRAFLLANAHITGIRPYTSVNSNHATIKMEELTLSFDRLTEVISQAH